MLRGRRLISGSYDETIRFWELPERGVGVGMNAAAISASLNGNSASLGMDRLLAQSASDVFAAGIAECKTVLRVGKVVSCLDWLIDEGR